MITRLLDLPRLLGKTPQSALLFGPRGSGKTRLSLAFLRGKSPLLVFDLLDNANFTRFLTQPDLFKHEVEGGLKPRGLLTVFVDEVQRLPQLLNDVHSLIESHKGKVRFLLTGSSARKLKRGGANLLAGRAWTLHLHPLTHREGVRDLRRALSFGTLPAIYLEDASPERSLKAYVDTYLKEEIQQEALTRKVDGYVRFLEVAAQMNGAPLNFSSIARVCGVSVPTAQEFFSILVDTMIAFRVEGWAWSVRKQLRQSPKLYFFDCGVLNAVRGELTTELKTGSFRYGMLFETFIVQEFFRLNDYQETGFRMHYWRSNSGVEVDVVLSRGPSDRPIAVEIKSSATPNSKDLRGLHSFKSENKHARLFCLCQTPRPYEIDGVKILPWTEGLATLFPYPPV
ncbi:MAG: ATP-binding protein [Elusimicrobia bacterium]|nr:ATP-binding protein [Elusimicrobiota bacterium]